MSCLRLDVTCLTFSTGARYHGPRQFRVLSIRFNATDPVFVLAAWNWLNNIDIVNLSLRACSTAMDIAYFFFD